MWQHLRRRRESQISTASSADIAFLLLIFFLVVATIDIDTGIGMVLPPKLDVPPPKAHQRNVLTVLVNDRGELLVEDRLLSVDELREVVTRHVLNCKSYDCSRDFAESPGKAIVSIKTGRRTPYLRYIEVLDEVWMSYFEMWDAEARMLGYDNYRGYVSSLGLAPDLVRNRLKPQISIAEPDE